MKLLLACTAELAIITIFVSTLLLWALLTTGGLPL